MSREREGKKFETAWVNVDGRRFEYEIRVRTITKSWGKLTEFFVNVTSPFKFYEVDTDVNKLREKVKAEYAARMSIKWKRVLLVHVDGVSSRIPNGDDPMTGESGRGVLEVSFVSRDVGVNHEGKSFYREQEGGHAYEGGKMDGQCWSNHGSGKQVSAVIDDTPENREALNAVIRMMSALRKQLYGIMGQDVLEKTLALINKNGAAKALAAYTPPPEESE